LRIDAVGSTLAEILAKVASATGMKIDVPAAANRERMPVVVAGPGPAFQIVASLLSDTDFDYVMQASDTDPEKLQYVLLLPREKKSSGGNGTDAAALPSSGRLAKAVTPVAPPEDTQPADSPPPSENTIADANLPNSQPAPAQPGQDGPPPPEQHKSTTPPLYGQPFQTNAAKVFPVPPPSVLSQQNISQQLQQMYQQRMQMVQQDRQAAAPPNPGQD